jgi:hypothetical protein
MSRNDSQTSAVSPNRFSQLWLTAPPDAPDGSLVYRPAVLVECSINFRSIKAGINDSQERVYTAWLSDGVLPVDWDASAIERLTADMVEAAPSHRVAMPETAIILDDDRATEIEADLVDMLVRRERLKLLYNPLFNLFSYIGETKDDFAARAAEAALERIEPEMKKLKGVFELRLEQVREAQLRKGRSEIDDGHDSSDGKAEIERLLLGRTEFRAAETRITSLFTGRADFVIQIPALHEATSRASSNSAPELQDDLRRIEEEASDALADLYARYLEMVHSYDEFEVGIQASNVRVLRRALLWVPVRR